ncbi:hypothetical protein [Streptomyces sp. NBC_01431]|nr:hypothetical protein [Streptomyces sp. NBC_01431]
MGITAQIVARAHSVFVSRTASTMNPPGNLVIAGNYNAVLRCGSRALGMV